MNQDNSFNTQGYNTNNQNFNTYQQPSFDSKPPKKTNLGLIIGIVASIIAVIVGVIIAFSLLNNNDETNNSNNNGQTSNENSNEVISNKCEVNEEKVTGLKGENLDYYYNIDISKFDKTKFNGKINFFGVELDNKITVAELKRKGVSTEIDYYRKNDYGFWCDEGPEFSIDTTTNIINSDIFISNTWDQIKVCNYTGVNDMQSDDALITLGSSWNLTGRNIYPSQLGIQDYSEITIDLIIEKLGNPTYVKGRSEKCLPNIYGYTTYYYIYDEVAFLFAFYNNSNLKLASVFYYPIEELNGTACPDCENSVLDNLEKEKNEYLKK